MTATLLKRRNGGGVSAKRAVGRARRHFRVRRNLRGTPERPRLVVTRSTRNITAQIVDAQGQAKILSEPRVFHIRQETVGVPSRAQGPTLRPPPPKPTPKPGGGK